MSSSVYQTLRKGKGAKRSPDEVIDVDAEGDDDGPAQKQPRTSERSQDAARSNKFGGDDVLLRVPTTAQGGGLRAPPTLAPLPTTSFYGAVASAVRSVTNRLSAGAAGKPQQPVRASHNVAGSSRLVPMLVGDDDDVQAAPKATTQLAAVEDWSVPLPPVLNDEETVTVESSRAWIGTRQASSCRLDFTSHGVSLWASFPDGGGDVFYPDLQNDGDKGIITKLKSAYLRTDEASWPPGFCAILALETRIRPDDELYNFYDPFSPEAQRRSLCCLFLDNNEWAEKQRMILATSKSWRRLWKKLSIDEQDDLMVARRAVHVAGAPRSARLRARDRRSASPQLHAPLVYPPDDADSVIVTNSDLRRLETSEFLNDSLVDFALKRLQWTLAQTLAPAEYQRKFHFFNCFFFKKLLTDDHGSASSRKLPDYADKAYARVRKWTARVDLFSKDFIVVPVNQTLHWSLVVICNLSEAERLLDERSVADSDVIDVDGETADVIDIDGETAAVKGPSPVILHLNSMSGTHANVEDVLRDYLAREWAARRGQPLKRGEALFGKTGPVAFCRPSVPQQDNFYDCGVFLIEFAQRFCLNTPVPYLSTRAEDGWPYMLRPTWFLPTDAGEANRDALRGEILSLGESLKFGAAGAGPATAAPVVSLVGTDDDDEDAPLAGLLVRKEPAAPAAADPVLTLSDDDVVVD